MAHLWKKGLAAEARGGGSADHDSHAPSRSSLPDAAESAYEDMLRRTSRPSQPSMHSPPRRGVSFGDRFLHEFDDEEECDEEEELNQEENVVRGHKSTFDDARVALGGSSNETAMRMRWNSNDLRVLTIVTSILAVFATGVLPIVDHFIWYRYDARLLSVSITYWLAAALIGALGVAAAHYRKPYLMAFHVMLGFMLGVCLGSYSVSIHYDMETRCDTMQAAFVGCGGCECSWDNSCTWANLTQIPSCKRCQAYPVEVCRNIIIGLGNGLTLTSVMGLLALVFTAVPVTTNLMMLLRLEAISGEAFKSKIGLDVVQLEHQYQLISHGEEPTIRPSALDLLLERVRERGHGSLADKVQAALSVYMAYKKPKRVTLKSIAQSLNQSEVGRLVDQVMRGKENAGFHRLSDLGDDGPMEESVPITPHPSRRDMLSAKSRKGIVSLRSVYGAMSSPNAMGYVASPTAADKGKQIETSPSGGMDVATSSNWSMSRFHGDDSAARDVDSDFDLDFS
mmetsp:Transcript_5794/g.16279  ORF Transcript_5794/g.16279 Transcript_5794/m.16279 type:complete len:509 (-) Transcript_5794:174-1700(-)|eukprot:CAMPEP_0117685466 /NCGR_PEP_ID=MMETSP0804-20121206/21768_1 /TAXON_ID=1074897 /ORGANISM="Tetraselmis astigmatica, Strain CCMP880" /LENGTH=508 /DNA_ID=CAMNT_0005496767 /DNA_START=134 /DNA_END=1660 /DNA_ORIENTATION=+